MRGWRTWAAGAAVGVILGAGPMPRSVDWLVQWPTATAGMITPDAPITVPCVLEGAPRSYVGTCEVDTGAQVSLVVPPAIARAVNFHPIRSLPLTAVGGITLAGFGSVHLTVGGEDVELGAFVATTPLGIPLIGLSGLRALGRYVFVDLQGQQFGIWGKSTNR